MCIPSGPLVFMHPCLWCSLVFPLPFNPRRSCVINIESLAKTTKEE